MDILERVERGNYADLENATKVAVESGAAAVKALPARPPGQTDMIRNLDAAQAAQAALVDGLFAAQADSSAAASDGGHAGAGGPNRDANIVNDDGEVRFAVRAAMVVAEQLGSEVLRPTDGPAYKLNKEGKHSRTQGEDIYARDMVNAAAAAAALHAGSYEPVAVPVPHTETMRRVVDVPGSGEKSRLRKPDYAAFQLAGLKAVYVDLHDPAALATLADHGRVDENGAGAVPCNNASCPSHATGVYTTVPTGSSKSAPVRVVHADGTESYMGCATSQCEICETKFRHDNSTTLAYCPPALTNALPMETEYGVTSQKQTIVLGKDITSGLNLDATSGNTFAHCFEKAATAAKLERLKREEAYVMACTAYHRQLLALAGDDVWTRYGKDQKIRLAMARAELLTLHTRGQLGPAIASFPADLPPPGSAELWRAQWATFAEGRRDLMTRYAASMGAKECISIDFTAQDNLGAKWLVTFCNEDGVLIGEAVYDSTNLDSSQKTFQAIAARPNFGTGLIGVVDNVPPDRTQADETSPDSKMASKLKDWMRLKAVINDRFHAVKSFTEKMNCRHEDHYDFCQTQFRETYSVADAKAKAAVDAKLIAGEISLKQTWRGKVYHVVGGELGAVTPMSDADIDWQFETRVFTKVTHAVIARWEKMGLYHALFSTSRRCYVPRALLDKRTIQSNLDALKKRIFEKTFEGGNPIQDRNGKILCPSKGEVAKHVENIRRRLTTCLLPESMAAFTYVKKCPTTGLSMYRPFGSTSMNEYVHRLIHAVFAPGNSGDGTTNIAKLTMAIPRLQRRAQAARANEKGGSEGYIDLGHDEPWRNARIDHLMRQDPLVHGPPRYNETIPPAPGQDDQVGRRMAQRFDKGRSTKTSQELHQVGLDFHHLVCPELLPEISTQDSAHPDASAAPPVAPAQERQILFGSLPVTPAQAQGNAGSLSEPPHHARPYFGTFNSPVSTDDGSAASASGFVASSVNKVAGMMVGFGQAVLGAVSPRKRRPDDGPNSTAPSDGGPKPAKKPRQEAGRRDTMLFSEPEPIIWPATKKPLLGEEPARPAAAMMGLLQSAPLPPKGTLKYSAANNPWACSCRPDARPFGLHGLHRSSGGRKSHAAGCHRFNRKWGTTLTRRPEPGEKVKLLPSARTPEGGRAGTLEFTEAGYWVLTNEGRWPCCANGSCPDAKACCTQQGGRSCRRFSATSKG